MRTGKTSRCATSLALGKRSFGSAAFLVTCKTLSLSLNDWYGYREQVNHLLKIYEGRSRLLGLPNVQGKFFGKAKLYRLPAGRSGSKINSHQAIKTHLNSSKEKTPLPPLGEFS